MNDRPCRGCRRDLSAYMDGELSSRRERALRLHLEGCQACRDHLEELRLVARETGSLDPPPPEDLEASILRGLEAGLREKAPPLRSPWRSPLLVGASAVVLAAVVGLGLVSLRDLPSFSPQSRPVKADRPLPTEEPAPGRPERGSAEGSEPFLMDELSKDAAGGGPEDQAVPEREKRSSPLPPEGAMVQRTRLGNEAERHQGQDVRVTGELEATGEARQSSVPQASEREAPAKKGERAAVAAAAEPSVLPPLPDPTVTVELAEEREGKGLAQSACSGPPLATAEAGEVLGCLGDAAGRPVRIVLRPEPVEDFDDFRSADLRSDTTSEGRSSPMGKARAEEVEEAEEAEQDAASRPLPWPELLPGPLPVPAAAATRSLELLLDLRLAPDGGVLSVEAVPPAEEGSLAAAVCTSVARWRFRPMAGEGRPGERRLRMALRLEPATR